MQETNDQFLMSLKWACALCNSIATAVIRFSPSRAVVCRILLNNICTKAVFYADVATVQVKVAAESVKNTAETDVKQSQFVCDTEAGQNDDAVSILSL